MPSRLGRELSRQRLQRWRVHHLLQRRCRVPRRRHPAGEVAGEATDMTDVIPATTTSQWTASGRSRRRGYSFSSWRHHGAQALAKVFNFAGERSGHGPRAAAGMMRKAPSGPQVG